MHTKIISRSFPPYGTHRRCTPLFSGNLFSFFRLFDINLQKFLVKILQKNLNKIFLVTKTIRMQRLVDNVLAVTKEWVINFILILKDENSFNLGFIWGVSFIEFQVMILLTWWVFRLFKRSNVCLVWRWFRFDWLLIVCLNFWLKFRPLVLMHEPLCGFSNLFLYSFS